MSVEQAKQNVDMIARRDDAGETSLRPTLLQTIFQISAAGSEVARQQGLSSALTFWSKANRDPRALASWINFIISHYLQHTGDMPNARVLRKPQRNYGVLGRPVAERVAALIHHYQFAAQHVPAPLYKQLLKERVLDLARLEGRGAHITISLATSLGYEQKQEGEWTLLARDADNRVLARMAFSIDVDTSGQPNVLIGGLQGLGAGADKSIIVKATRALSGLRPKDAALVGVQAIARTLGINRVFAVANQTHVLAAEWAFSDSVISRDYDEFWLERGGVALPGIGYALPLIDYAARIAGVLTPRIVDQHRARLAKLVQETLSSPAQA